MWHNILTVGIVAVLYGGSFQAMQEGQPPLILKPTASTEVAHASDAIELQITMQNISERS